MRLCTAVACLALLPLTVVAQDDAIDSTLDWSGWTAPERALIESLWLENLPELPDSPGNPVADAPAAVALGHRLFFDTRLSADGRISCASCHRPDQQFSDDRPRGVGIGETERRTMSLVGAAYSPWLYWDGRKDSLWSQALDPLETGTEHGLTRVAAVRTLLADDALRRDYERVFGPPPSALAQASAVARLPTAAGPRGDDGERAAWEAIAPAVQDAVSRVYADIGRALEAYQRRLLPDAAPFDRFVDALQAGDAERAGAALHPAQRRGLRRFIGSANCVHCHNGPLFTNNEFHATGVGSIDRLPDDRGRVDAVPLLLADEFNCLGAFAGVEPARCGELTFVKRAGIELVAAFRTPSLRNVTRRAPYAHDGSQTTLREVLEHYDAARPTLISDDLEPLGLDESGFVELEAFLEALESPLRTDPAWLSPPGR